MNVELIVNGKDAENFCEGLINDLLSGIIDKDEAMDLLAKCTIRIIVLTEKV